MPGPLIGVLWIASFAVGVAWQWRSPTTAAPWNKRIFNFYFHFFAPIVVLYAYSVVPADRSTLTGLAAVIVASWAVLGIGLLYARWAARDRGEQGALALGSGFTNTVTLGYPVVNAVFGKAGLALQVLFAQFMYLIPIVSVSTTIAAHFGNGSRPRSVGGILRQIVNVPLVFAVIAVALRVAGFDVAGYVERPTDWVVFAMGPIGFLELGLALPLDRVSHDVHDLWRAAGPILIRLLIAPLVLLAIGLAIRADIPRVYFLSIAMPAAFHTLILARVYGLPGPMMRLIVVISSVIMVAAIMIDLAFFR
ncbi:MAG: AEC family transporter [Gaiellales bacterium]